LKAEAGGACVRATLPGIGFFGGRMIGSPGCRRPMCSPIRPAAVMALRLKCEFPTLQPMHTYEVRPRSDKRGFDLISDALPFGRLWYS
jgi:hypothetical protein